MMKKNDKYYSDVAELINLLEKASEMDMDAFNWLIQINSHTFWLAPCVKKDHPNVAAAVEKIYDALNTFVKKAKTGEVDTFGLFVEFCLKDAKVLLEELKNSME